MVAISEWTKSTYKIGQELEIDKIFRLAVKHDASDIHLQVNRPPVLRVKGTLRELQMDPIGEEEMIDLTFPMLDQRNLDIFHRDGGADFSKRIVQEGDEWRFRVNLLTQLGLVGMVTRKVERFIPPFEKLYLPPVMESLCKYDQGMVLLSGVTGSSVTRKPMASATASVNAGRKPASDPSPASLAPKGPRGSLLSTICTSMGGESAIVGTR